MPLALRLLGFMRKTPVQIQHLLIAAKEVEEYADRNLSHLKARALAPPPRRRLPHGRAATSLLLSSCPRCAVLTENGRNGRPRDVYTGPGFGTRSVRR